MLLLTIGLLSASWMLPTIQETSPRIIQRQEYSFEIPEGWRLATQEELSRAAEKTGKDLKHIEALLVNTSSESDTFVENITVLLTRHDARNRNNTLPYYTQQYKESLGGNAFLYEPIEAKIIPRKDLSYFSIQHRLQLSENAPTLRQWIAILPSTRLDYVLTYTVEESLFQSHSPAFEQFVAKFKPAEDNRYGYPPAGLFWELCLFLGSISVVLFALKRVRAGRTPSS
ncbi:MAG TPA: hypothetical protein PKY35_09910 [Candidatus Hydrogenedentes bacterium]|nr:hypothetical protein [Candidatus Hydrogenedentota bacterium]HOL77334.1 hypothetical protein [Candidatus Hydrogenedentota bacterium]HPO84848.1 hypothetical protein [Candidatus Hydrogenedentota bacterium]